MSQEPITTPCAMEETTLGTVTIGLPTPPTSIALQSWGVSHEAIGVLLLSMQTMQFFLRTGYGESSLSYGGSEVDRTLGLGQGNAAAGPRFLPLSSQIVRAYVRDSHGSRLVTSY